MKENHPELESLMAKMEIMDYWLPRPSADGKSSTYMWHGVDSSTRIGHITKAVVALENKIELDEDIIQSIASCVLGTYAQLQPNRSDVANRLALNELVGRFDKVRLAAP